MKLFDSIVAKAKKDKNILAVVAFGSFARGEKYRDVDVCIVLKEKAENAEMSKLRLEYLKNFPETDIQIFQQLPLYIRIRVLKEGKIIFCRDKDTLYDAAFAAIREFEDFKPLYKSYLEGVLYA